MQNSTAISIKEYAAKYTLIMFAVILFAALLQYFAYNQYLNNLQEKEYQKTLIHISNSVSRSLSFYQSVVDELASQHSVVDLLQFGSDEESQRWANNMQRLLPESIGLALFDVDANVKGLHGELRLSDRCIADMGHRFQNRIIPRPPVHYKIAALAHYDIVSPIMNDDEQIGVVFASFSLHTIKRLLTGLYHKNQGIIITTPEGYQIASVGNLNSLDKNVEVFNKTIEHTDWEIELLVKSVEKNVLVTSLFISNAAVFILLSFTLYFAIKRLFNVVVSDFEVLSWLMKKIKDGTYESKDVSRVSLKESQSVIRFIMHTAEELDAYQKKLKTESTTDELTGLHNRRVLNEKIDECLIMANQNHKLYMVILDLDNFKKINDTYGHDAGDAVLMFLSETLKHICVEKDICTRAGGDEFIVVLMDYELEEINQWYLALNEAVMLKIEDYNEQIRLALNFGISAGCTFIRNNDRKSTVFKRADDALYKVKESGGNRIEFL